MYQSDQPQPVPCDGHLRALQVGFDGRLPDALPESSTLNDQPGDGRRQRPSCAVILIVEER